MFERVVAPAGQERHRRTRNAREREERRRGGLDTRPTPIDVNIAAGQLATGLKASNGTRYGSDNFFTGGAGAR